MSYFDDIMKHPLPSKMGESYDVQDDYFESSETSDDSLPDLDFFEEDSYDDFEKEMQQSMDEFKEESDDDDFDDFEDDDEDDMDDLDDLEEELGVTGALDEDDVDDLGEDLDKFGEDDYYTPKSVDDPTPAEPVNAEDDEEADHAMAVTATPIVLGDEMSVEECADFIESGEGDILVNEGLMLESDLDEMRFGLDEVYTEGAFASPTQKFKMTKKARLKQLYEISLQIEARAHHDPYYKILQKAYAIERKIKKGWRKRYDALAKKRAMRYLKRLEASGSSTAKKAAKQLVKK